MLYFAQSRVGNTTHVAKYLVICLGFLQNLLDVTSAGDNQESRHYQKKLEDINIWGCFHTKITKRISFYLSAFQT